MIWKNSLRIYKSVDYSEEIKIILPKELTFLFELSKEECHLKFTGTCSLDRWLPDRRKDIGKDSDYDKCPKIFKSLKKYGQDHNIDVIKYNCGHYSFNDGQHRVCIAKRRNLKLTALITTVYNEACRVCSNKAQKNSELR